MIQVDNAFAVAAPPEVVFDALSDAETVVQCLPGTRVVGAVDGRNVLGQARVAFGRNSISYRGSIHVTGDDRAAGRISFRVRGREVRGEGIVEAIVDVVLREDREHGTVATVQADASISGRAAAFTPDVVEAAARTLLTRFGVALAERMAARPTPAAPTPPPTPTRSAPVLKRPTLDDERNAQAVIDDGRASAPHVAGEVRLMTKAPVVLDGDAAGPLPQIAIALERRPWLAPAALMALLIAVILLRRRR